MEENQKNVRNEELVDWEGNSAPEPSFKKIIVPEENYDFLVKSVELIDTKNFDGVGTKKTIKMLLEISDKVFPEHNGNELPFFVSPIITKGNTNSSGKVFSNSKLYDLLTDTGLKEKAKEKGQFKRSEFADKITAFLEESLVGKTVRGKTSISKKNTSEAYSVVTKITKLY